MSKNEVKPAEQSVAEARKRAPKPGMVRVMISLTKEQYDRIEQMAREESPVYPRPVNEFISILINKRFDSLCG